MRRLLSVLLIVFCAITLSAQDDFDSFEDFLDAIDAIEIQADADALMESLIEAGRVPFAIGEQVAFLYQDADAEQVDWRGDFSGWEALEQYAGQRIGETDLWLMTTTFPADARLDYKIVVDDSQWLLDPANPRTQVGGLGPNSTLQMPDYVPSEWVTRLPDIARGELGMVTTHNSRSLGYTVNYRVYTPDGYADMDALPVIYVTDGHEYADDDMGSMVIVLDNLIAEGLIDPVIAVFIDPRNPEQPVENRRESEFLENPDYAAFIAEELVPTIDIVYDTSTDSADRAILGTSFGGVNALYLGASYPDVFGKVAAQSPSVWAMAQIDLYLNYPENTDNQFFVSNGRREWDSFNIDVVLDLLDGKGIDHLFVEVNEGHSWGNWRALLDDMLVYFFGA